MILSQAWKQGDLMHLHSFWQCFYHNNIPIFNEFPDAAYYAYWLSIVYILKDRLLKNLLVFSSKIEYLTFLTLVCLQTEGKREKSPSFVPNIRFAKIRYIGDNFADWGCKIRDGFTDFGVGFCGLIRGESCFAFELGFRILLQPKEKVCRSGLARSWRSHLFFSLC